MSLETIQREFEKLQFLKLLELPGYLNSIPQKEILRHYCNICTKYPSAIKQRYETHRSAMSRILLFFEKDSILLTFHLQQLDKPGIYIGDSPTTMKILK